MKGKKGIKLLLGILFAVVLTVSSYVIYDVAVADHSDTEPCYNCHTLKATDIRPDTSSILASVTDIGNVRLCEVCHKNQKNFDFSKNWAASAHPTHVITNYSPNSDFWSPNSSTVGGLDSASPFYSATAGNAVECWNCHNSNQVTDQGPNQFRNGYPDHIFEDLVRAPNPPAGPPWDYLEYHLYTNIDIRNTGTRAYTYNDFNFCFGGNSVPDIGSTPTLFVGSAAGFPGCHGTATPTIRDKSSTGGVTGFAIEDYYSQTTRASSPTPPIVSKGHYIKVGTRATPNVANNSKIACYTCHNSHASQSNARLFKGAYDAVGALKPGSTNLTTVVQECRICHGYDEAGYPAPTQIRVYTSGDPNAAGILITPMAPPFNSTGNLPAEHAASAAVTNPCYSCHNVHNPDPSIDQGDCKTCHLTAANAALNQDVDRQDGQATSGRPKPMIDRDQWFNLGHGATGMLPVTNKDIDSGGPLAGPAGDCADCHNVAVPHFTSTNPYRLWGYSGTTVGAYIGTVPDSVCASCHDVSDSGVLRHDEGGFALPSDGYTNGKCMDCHDPHGDSIGNTNDSVATGMNVAMIQRDVVIGPLTNLSRWVIGGVNSGNYGNAVGRTYSMLNVGYRATGNQSDFVANNIAVSRICEACHTDTTTDYFRRNDADTIKETSKAYHVDNTDQCVRCHEHANGCAAPIDCRGCHSAPQGTRPAIVVQIAGKYEFIGSGAGAAMSRHISGSTNGLTSIECFICHLEGDMTLLPTTTNQYKIQRSVYHAGTPGGLIDLRDQKTGLALAGYNMDLKDTNGYTTSSYLLNSTMCGGCHDYDSGVPATGATWWGTTYAALGATRGAPFNNAGMIGNKSVGANDITPPPNTWARYNTNTTTNYSKYVSRHTGLSVAGDATNGYNTVPRLIKSSSPHGFPGTNETKNEDTVGSQTQPNTTAGATFNATPVACLHCHPAHGSDTRSINTTTLPAVSYTNLGARQVMTRLQEPQLCWNCHSMPAGGVLDFYGDTDLASSTPLQWGTASNDSWARTGSFTYKSAAITVIHPVRGASDPGNNPDRVFCSVCHDPHGVRTTTVAGVTGTTHAPFMVPILRKGPTDPGGWMTSPYKEDRAGQKNGSVWPEDMIDYDNGSVVVWGGTGYSYGTYALWGSTAAGTSGNVGPRVEPYNISGSAGYPTKSTTVNRFEFNNPIGIGGGYGDAAGGGTGHDGFFLNDNTFGIGTTAMAPGSSTSRYLGTYGAASGATRVPRTTDPFEALDMTASNVGTPAPTGGSTAAGTFDEKFGGFCRNCHNGGATDEYGGWTGHHSVYGHTASNDLYPINLAKFTHGGPRADATQDEIRVIASTSSTNVHGGLKWATVQGNAGVNWQYSPGGVVNYHEFTCSKCHTPHASVINKIMRSNCLSGATDSGNPITGQPSRIDTTVGNYSMSSSSNQRNWTIPVIPRNANSYGEEFSMHCHNSNRFATNSCSTRWGATGCANTTFDGGWLKLPVTAGMSGCGATTCHDYQQTTVLSGAHQKHINDTTNGTTWSLVDCTVCHQYQSGGTVANNPLTGTHSDGNGLIQFKAPVNSTIATTTVCDPCHSTYDPDGVGPLTSGSVKAKANWSSDTPLACTDCHNETSQLVSVLLTGTPVQAANITGDGTSYGWAVNGHGSTAPEDNGLESFQGFVCADCHDATKPHIDGNPLSGSSKYRLDQSKFGGTDVTNGTAKVVGQNACLACHANAAYLPTARTYTPSAKRAQGSTNAVLNHDSTTIYTTVGYSRTPANLTWSFQPACNNCHDLHGSLKRYLLGSMRNNLTTDTTQAYLTVENEALGSSGANNKAVYMDNPTYSLGYTGTPRGPCVTCHQAAGGVTHDTKVSADNHFDDTMGSPGNGTVCTGCHPHSKGMAPGGCDTCHGYGVGHDNKANDATNAVGSLEQPTVATVPEAGAHTFHTLESAGLNSGDSPALPLSGAPWNYELVTANTGFPKLGFKCLNSACHMTDMGQDTDHNNTNDQMGELKFDLLDGEYTGTYNVSTSYINSGDPIIIKNANSTNSVLGNGVVDLRYQAVGANESAKLTGKATLQSTNTTCNNVYCHSTVLKPTTFTNNMEFWTTGTPAPRWNDRTSVYCGTCHNDSGFAVVTHVPAADIGSPPSTMGHTGAIMASGSHSKHVNRKTDTPAGYTFTCVDCHNGRGRTDTTTTIYHVNGYVDLNITKTVGSIAVTGTYSVTGAYTGTNQNKPGTPTPPNPATTGRSGRCLSVYCHSNAMQAKAGPFPGPFTATQQYWGEDFGPENGSARCKKCHGSYVVNGTSVLVASSFGEPNYKNGAAVDGYAGTTTPGGTQAANSHYGHVVSFGAECNDCHDTTMQNTAGQNAIEYTGSSFTHANGTIEVASPTYTFSYSTLIGQKTCTNSCHGNNPPTLPKWGATGINSCFMCHDGTEALVRPVALSNGIAEKVNYTEYTTKGHGRSDLTNYNSGNIGAGFMWDTAQPYLVGVPGNPGCVSTQSNPATPNEGCHNFISAGAAPQGYKDHWTKKIGGTIGGDNFYLSSSFNTNMDALCLSLNCHTGQIKTHSEANTGSMLNTGCEPNVNWNNNATSPNVWGTTSRPPKCIDCHDPHGDGNEYMVKYAIATSGSISTATADYGTPQGAMRNVTFSFANPAALNADTYYDATTTNGICQVCHTQNSVYNNIATNPTAITHNFVAATGRPCTDCHVHLDGIARPSINYAEPQGLGQGATCENCHVAGNGGAKVNTANNDDTDNYTFGTQPALPARAKYCDRAYVDGAQWTTAGHGNTTSLPPTSKGTMAGPALGCVTTDTAPKATRTPINGCHDQDVDHGDATNPFRLPAQGLTNAKAIVLQLCLHPENGCHGTSWGSTGVDAKHHVDAVNLNMYENGICTDCHDPHGDTSRVDAALTAIPDVADANGGPNTAMVQREVVWENRWTAGPFGNPLSPSVNPVESDKLEPISRFFVTGAAKMSDFVKDSATVSGICEVCHRNAGTMYFRRLNADNNSPPRPKYHLDPGNNTACTSCHGHPNGFQNPIIDPPGKCNCYACHTGVETQFGYATGGLARNQIHDIRMVPTQVNNPIVTFDTDCSNVDCLKCHDLDTGANHMLGTVYLKDTDPVGNNAITSPSIYSESGSVISYGNIGWGNIKAADPTGAWCGGCHRAVGAVTWTLGTVLAPDTTSNFATTGHGQTQNASGDGLNFTRYAPNDPAGSGGAGRASCTACHNYHGSTNRAMIKRGTYSGSYTVWNEPQTYPEVDNYVQGASPDAKENFCLQACHLNTAYDARVATTRPSGKREHFLIDDATNPSPIYTSSANYFVSKKVGFVMGGNNLASPYVADTANGEQQVFNPDANNITTVQGLAMGDNLGTTPESARALCATCHDPHGSSVNTSWGHNGATDDNMLRGTKYNATTGFYTGSGFTGAYEQCQACHQ